MHCVLYTSGGFTRASSHVHPVSLGNSSLGPGSLAIFCDQPFPISSLTRTDLLSTLTVPVLQRAICMNSQVLILVEVH